MPFSSGTFSRIYNWVNEQLSSPIEISKLDAQQEDFATALNNCILRDGTGLPTAAMDWNGQNLTNVAALTATGIITGGRFVPTSSSVPTNGMYLSAANTLAWSTNTTLRLSLDSSGVLTSTGNMVSPAFVPNGSTVPANGVYLPAANTVGIATNTTLRWSVNSTGTHTFAAPSAGATLTLTGLTGAAAFVSKIAGATNNPQFQVTHTESTGATRLNATADTSGLLEVATNGTLRTTWSAAGNVSISAPSSGTALTVNGVSGAPPLVLTPASGSQRGMTVGNGTVDSYWAFTAGNVLQIGTAGAHALSVITQNASRIDVAAAGNVTINAPSSGTAFSVTGASGLLAANFQGAAADSVRVEITKGGGTAGTDSFALIQDTGSIARLFNRANAAMDFSTNGTQRVNIAAGGAVTINAPSSGVGLTIAGGGLTVTGTITGDGSGLTTLSATNLSSGTVNTARISGSYTGITAIGAATINDSGGSPFNAGYLGMPQSTNTSLVLTDRGKHILLSGTTNTVTIPANASVAFEVGSTIVLINDGSGNTTLNITTDTLEWYQGGASTTGSGRTIATKSVVTLVKVASTRWVLSGSGIS